MVYNLCVSKFSICKILFCIILFANIFFALFPAWKLSPIWIAFNSVDLYFSVWNKTATLINFFLSVLIVSFDRRWYSKYLSYSLLILCASFTLSIVVNQFQSGLLAIIGIPITYLTLFIIIERYKINKNICYITLLIFLVWSILPVLLVVLGSYEVKLALFTSFNDSISTFGGFALHRNMYGFYTGLAILITYMFPIKILYKIVAILFMCIGLMLSGSRSTLLSVFVCIFFYICRQKTKYKYLLILFFINLFATILFLFFAMEIRIGEEDEGRKSLFIGFCNVIKNNIWFGQGSPVLFYSALFPEGSPAHNILLQTWANFGLIVLVLFLLFLLIVFLKANLRKRIILIYLFIFSFFQPYFCFGMPDRFLCISIFIAIIINSINEKNTHYQSRPSNL